MSVGATRVVVGTSPTRIAGDNAGMVTSAVMKNITGTSDIFLGGPSVAVADGFEWDPADPPLSIEIPHGGLYGIVAATPQTVHVLKAGRN